MDADLYCDMGLVFLGTLANLAKRARDGGQCPVEGAWKLMSSAHRLTTLVLRRYDGEDIAEAWSQWVGGFVEEHALFLQPGGLTTLGAAGAGASSATAGSGASSASAAGRSGGRERRPPRRDANIRELVSRIERQLGSPLTAEDEQEVWDALFNCLQWGTATLDLAAPGERADQDEPDHKRRRRGGA